MEAATSHDINGCSEEPQPFGRKCSVDDGRSAAEAPCASAIDPGDQPSPSSSPSTGEGRKGQEQGQGQGISLHRTEGLQTGQDQLCELTREAFQNQLQQLILLNHSTMCFANSAFQMVMWTLASFTGSEVSTLQIGDTPLSHILQQAVPMHLGDCPWFQHR